jgi:hypothetical protein
MPMQRELYPNDWEAIALAIKEGAAWTCQQCGRPCRRPGQCWDEFEVKHGWLWPDAYEEDGDEGIAFKKGRFVLGVAHLDHQPANCSPENLRAWCNVCHCRYDLRAMATKRRLAAERHGQLTLPL